MPLTVNDLAEDLGVATADIAVLMARYPGDVPMWEEGSVAAPEVGHNTSLMLPLTASGTCLSEPTTATSPDLNEPAGASCTHVLSAGRAGRAIGDAELSAVGGSSNDCGTAPQPKPTRRAGGTAAGKSRSSAAACGLRPRAGWLMSATSGRVVTPFPVLAPTGKT